MKRAVWLPLLFAATACGAAAAPSSVHEAEIVSVTPTQNAVAASTRFLGCPVEDEERARCYACDVRMHDKGEEGLLAYASHWEHDLKPWDDRDGLQVSVSGEVAETTFERSERTAEAARALFAEAEAWCEGRGTGSYHLLKNDIDTVFGGAE